MELLELTAATAVLAALLWLFYYRHFSYWSDRGVPQARPWTPFGNTRKSMLAVQMLADDHDDIYKQFRDCAYAGFYRVRDPRILVIDPDLIRKILVKDFDYFTDRETVDQTEPILAHNIFFMKGERWRQLRNKLSPIFTSGKLKNMFQTLNECGVEMVDVVSGPARDGRPLELREVCALFTTDVIATLAFGIRLGCQRDPDCAFRRWAKMVFGVRDLNYKDLAVDVLCPPLRQLLKSISSRNDIFSFFDRMVKEIINDRLDSGTKRNDFMELFLQYHTKGFVDGEKNAGDTSKMTEDEIVAQSFLFYIAGFETSSTTMSFACYELAVNPDVQRLAQQEVDRVLGEDGPVTYEALSRMKYLDRVIAETLRKYPPVRDLNRVTRRPYRLPPPAGGAGAGAGPLLEPGVLVWVPVFSLHWDPAHYPDPERFDPDRFSDEAKAQRHPFIYLPFGEGPRFCIGMRLGLLQAKLGLVYLLRNYELQTCPETEIPLTLDPMASVTATKHGISLRFGSRGAGLASH